MKLLFQYKTFKIAIMFFLLLQFFVYGSEEMNLSTKKEKAETSSTKSAQLPNLPCIAYLSTKTGNVLPTGTILYGNLMSYSYDLFLLNYNSKPEINITNNPNSIPRFQSWSPDGKILAWIYMQGQIRKRLGIEAFENGQKSILIPTSDYFILRFAWSPSSDRIAFLGYDVKDRKLTNHGIYIFKISDKSITKIFDIEPGELFSSLYWVKNSLLWCNTNGTVEKLDIVDSEPKGSPKIIFDQENSHCHKITVSPDNNALAGIVKQVKQKLMCIWIFDLDGNNPHKLVDGEKFYESCAAWHPTDCNLLAFSSRTLEKQQGRLALYNFNTGKIAYIDLKSNYKSIKNISWSKDGRYITVACDRGDIKNRSSDILIYDIENSEWINITNSKDSRDFNPVCRP